MSWPLPSPSNSWGRGAKLAPSVSGRERCPTGRRCSRPRCSLLPRFCAMRWCHPRFPAAATEEPAECGSDSSEVLQKVGAKGRTHPRLVSVVGSRRLTTKITGRPLSRSEREEDGAFRRRGSARGFLLDRLTSSQGRTLWAKPLCPRKKDRCPPSERNRACLPLSPSCGREVSSCP